MIIRNFIIGAAALFALAACGQAPNTVREREAQRNAEAAQSIDFSAGNAERDNIIRRGQFVSQPDLVGYIVLLSPQGPVAYYTVRGKVTSSGKRLEQPLVNDCYDGVDGAGDSSGSCVGALTDAPSYDGTYGSSDQYVYFWTTAGQYVQWSTGNGFGYLYSDQPIQPNTAAAQALIEHPPAPSAPATP